MSAPTAPPPTANERQPSPPPSPSPRPPRRPYGLALLLIGGGIVWALALFGVPIRWSLVLPAALIVIGVLLLLDRSTASGGLIGVGIVLLVVSLVFVPLSSAADADFGERQVVITDISDLAEEHSLGVGSLRLDLRGLELEEGTVVPVSADVGIGELRVQVPEDVVVTGEARAGIGAVQGTSGSRGGFGVSTSLRDAEADEVPEGAAVLELDLEVGIGQVVVTR